MTKKQENSSRFQNVKIIFETTNLCNFSCVHCIRSEDGFKQYLPLTVVEKVLSEVKAYHSVSLVAFTGGEPTIHPKFSELIRLVAEAGYPFSFVTNGWQFQKVFKQIQPYKHLIQNVSFSIDGAKEETHDTIRRRAGSFRRIMQAISLYKFQGIPFQINMVITRANRAEIEEMAVLASRLGSEGLGYAHCQPTPDALAADLVMNAAERREAETEIAALQKIYQLPIYLAGDHFNENPFHQCPQLQMREFNIDYRGYLSACCTLSNYRGGLADSDIVADLNADSFYEAHQKLLEKIAQINREKIARIAAGPLDEVEKFICSHCLLHYQKVPDLKAALTQQPMSKKCTTEFGQQ